MTKQFDLIKENQVVKIGDSFWMVVLFSSSTLMKICENENKKPESNEKGDSTSHQPVN